MSGLLLAIDARIARLSEGVNVGYFDAINLPSLELTKPDPEVVNRISYMRSTYGQALDSYSRPKPDEITFTTDETAPDILSMAMLGTPASYAQSAGTDQVIAITASLDKWVALGKNNISALSIAGLTVGDDYEVNLEAGLVKILTGNAGTIDDGDPVNVTASYPARTGSKIVAGTAPVLQLAILGTGINLFTNEQVEIEIPQANVSPNGALSFVSSDPVVLSFKGTLVTPSGAAGPYTYTVHRSGS